MSERILIIDTEPRAAFEALEQGGFAVESAEGEDAVELLQRRSVDLVLLSMDLRLPRSPDVLRAIRNSSGIGHLPIIATSMQPSELDRVLAFELGADDFVPKPFSRRELVLRARAVLRRCRSRSGMRRERVALGPLEVEVASRSATVNGEAVHLTMAELRLLAYLMAHAGRVQRREDLIERLWPEADPGLRTIDTHVRRLREKLGGAAELIETVRGVGYRMPRPEELRDAG